MSLGNVIDALEYHFTDMNWGLGIINDVNSDGYKEIIAQKNGNLTIFDGASGSMLYTTNIKLNYSEFATFMTYVLGDTDNNSLDEVVVNLDHALYYMEFGPDNAKIIMRIPDYGQIVVAVNALNDLDNDGYKEYVVVGALFGFSVTCYWGRYDADWPTINWWIPENNSILNVSTITIEVSATDSSSGMGEVYVEVDFTRYDMVRINDSVYRAIATVEFNGTKFIDIYVSDKAEHTVYIPLVVYVDTEKPYISINSPDIIYTNKTSVKLSWSGDDFYSGIARYAAKVDEGDWINLGISTSYTFSLSEGTHTISIRAWDLAGNYATDTVSVIVDLTPPKLEILSPKNNTDTTNHTITIRWKGSDDLSGIDHYEVRVDNGFWSRVDGTITTLRVDYGKHIIYVKAVDRAGNSKIAKIFIEVYSVKITIGPVELLSIVIVIAIIGFLVYKLRRK